MTSLLPEHDRAAIGKAGFNALPKDARTGVADKTLGPVAPRLLILAVNIDHLMIKSRDVIPFSLHIGSDVRQQGSGAKPRCRGRTPLQRSDPAPFYCFILQLKEFRLLSIPFLTTCFPFSVCVCTYSA